MVHIFLLLIIGVTYFAISCIWGNIRKLNLTITAGTRSDLYAKLYSPQFVADLNALDKLLSKQCAALFLGAVAVVMLLIMWLYAALATLPMSTLWLSTFCMVLATCGYHMVMNFALPLWTQNFARKLTVERGKLNVAMYNERLTVVDSEIAQLMERTDTDSMSNEDAGRMIRLAYERTQLKQLISSTRAMIAQMQ